MLLWPSSGGDQVRFGLGEGLDDEGVELSCGVALETSEDVGVHPFLRTTGAERDELVRLRREVRTLKMERELLSRAAAFFAQENVLPHGSDLRFIEAEKADFPIRFACRVLERLTVGLRRLAPPATASERSRTLADTELTETIIEIHTASRGTYGAPRVHAELELGRGIRVGRKRVARLMRNARPRGHHTSPQTGLHPPRSGRDPVG